MNKEDQILALLKEIRDLLAGAPKAPTSRKRDKPARHEAASESVVDGLVHSKKDASEWHAIWDYGKPLDKWLAVLAIAENEAGESTALLGSEIAQVAKDRFRLNGVHATNVSRDLKQQRKFVTSAKRGSAFEYRLTREGLKHIAARRAELADGGGKTPTARGNRKSRPATKRSTTPKTPSQPKAKRPRKVAKPRKAAGGRPGPKAMLEDLIAKGFFKSARTITEVQDHLQKQRGHRYTPQDLSPALVRLLRSGALNRDTNADGTYEYRVG